MTEKRKNNLYTKGYFLKRLKDRGVPATPLIQYDNGDLRKWTVIAWPTTHRALITCYKKSMEDFWFKIETKTMTADLKTLSMDVVADQLKTSVEENNVTGDKKQSRRDTGESKE